LVRVGASSSISTVNTARIVLNSRHSSTRRLSRSNTIARYTKARAIVLNNIPMG
jgi:hypothetical protein